MSTSDPSVDQILNSLDLTNASQALAAGLPDPSVLARMAQEMFLAPISQNALGVESLNLANLSSAPQVSLPSANAVEPGSVLGALRTAVPGAVVPQAPVTAPTFESPGIAGGLSAADFKNAGDLSFLKDIRSLFAVPTSDSMSSLASQRILSEDPLRAVSSTVSVASSPLPEILRETHLPQITGAAAMPTGLSREASFAFLDEINPLVPIELLPTLSPVNDDLRKVSGIPYSSGPFDVGAIRRDFPILQERVNGRQIIWLDNAATTQKPQAVIDRLAYFYAHENSNIHRAAHTLAARATDAYEAAREKVRRFLNASSSREIIFVRGATEGINLIAQSWGKRHVQKDDEIIVTYLEHHANIVPWQMLCAEKGAKLRVAPVDNTGQILLDEYEKLFIPRTRLVSLAHVSNALGTVTPVQQMVEIAHRYGAKVVVDGAQAVSHMRVDVQEYDCDFYVFSGHKVFAPTGIGVVYGKQSVLDQTPPWQGGGNMIADVTFERTLYNPPPSRFEAGTGNIADAVGLGEAIDYVGRIGMVNVERYEHDLLVYATERLIEIPGLHLIGTATNKASVLSFVLDGFRTEEVGAALNEEGIAVRSGHHCAQPILRRFGVESTVRPSLAFYNTCDEIDALVASIWNIKQGRNSGFY